MKDITDYFSSPTKARKSSELPENVKSAVETSDQNVNTENKIENTTNEHTSDKNETKQSKRKRRRKPTDPEVKGMTELLSNNLSLVSPNPSVETKNNPSPLKNTDKKSKDDSLENFESSSDNKKKVSSSAKKEKVSRSTKKDKDSKSAKKDKPIKDNKSNKTPSKSIPNSPKENVLQDIDKQKPRQKPSNNEIVVIDDNESNSEPPKTTPKVNAFQFMMNSRNNILGQNSNGKTVKDEITSISEEKQKLASRKNLFKNWADQKGGLKRKREEEEVEKCIKVKMEQRAKRLKKLVQGKKENEIKVGKKRKTPLKSKKLVKKISSSESESSNDVIPVESKEDTILSTSLVNISEDIEENAQDVILTISSPPSKKHKENGKNNLLNFFGVVSRKENDEKIEIFDDSSEVSKESSKELIKIKMFTPASTKKRTSLLSLNKNHSKSMTDESSQESIKVKKHKKKKKKSKDVDTNSHKKVQLNDSMEDFCTPCAEEDSKSTKNLKENKVVETIEEGSAKEIDVVEVEESTEDLDVIKPKRKKNSNQCVIVDDSEESRSSEEGISKPRPDLDDDEPEILIKNDIIVLDGDFKAQTLSEDQNSTPANLKTRKKKNISDTKNSKEPLTDEIESKPSEAHDRVLRPKKTNLNYSDSFNNSAPKTPKSNKKEKNKNNQSKNESVEKVCLSSDSETEHENAKKAKRPVKVAPVFLKATPKPKPDPEVAEARKKFLMSGVPESLKITVEKQRSLEEREYNVFPIISHIQQKCESKLWDLPKPDLKLSEIVPFEIENKSLIFTNLIVRNMPYDIHITSDSEKINNINGLLKKIKTENPNYPVYKVFRHIYEKSGKNYLQDQVKSKTPKRRSKKSRKSLVPEEVSKADSILKDCEMWTEKYKPRCSEEILGNHNGVAALKNWLETWMNYSEEINARGKRKRANSNSESEFESTDCDSRDSTRLPGNTMILGGPCGSGKTSAVYAIANELGFNVLELNGSTKRTGKRLLQELQEATQSHQVRKKQNGLVNFINSSKDSNKDLQKTDMKLKKLESEDKSEPRDKKKMCILLVEDIDLVFDQDEGFLTSLTQLITTSKRPIILTTTDNSPAHIQKLISQYECISFMPLSLQCLGVWLQVLCLVEGLLVDKDDLGNLLEYNKGDIRKTLLELQFWSQSGGQLERDRVYPLSVQGSISEISEGLKATDEELKIALKEDDQEGNNFLHRHCLGSFETFRETEEYNVPPKVDLGMLWWNIPNILEIPSCAAERLNRQKGKVGDNQEVSVDNSEKDQQKLASLMNLYDAITLSDSVFNSVDYYKSNEPVIKNWMTEVRATLNLTERDDDKTMYLDLAHDVTHNLVNGCINTYKKIDKTSCRLNMAMPDTNERRWRAKQHVCEDFLKEPISLSNVLDRSSIALDYLPVLRHIARFEDKRASANTKRGNRFRHYLKNLNMTFKESACKLACNVLNVTLDE